MRRFAFARWSSAFALALMVFACSDGDAPTATPSKSGGAAKAPAQKAGTKTKTVAQAGFTSDATEQGAAGTAPTTAFGAAGLLERVPADAWLVARWPTFRAATDAWKTSELVKGLERAGMNEAALAVVDPIEALIEAAGAYAPPDAKPWFDAIKKVRGDAVVALLSVDPTARSNSGEPPTRVLAMITLGDAAPDVLKLVERLVKTMPRGTKCERVGTGHYILGDGDDHGELWLRDGRLELVLGVGCDPGRLDDILAKDASQSFATCAAYASAPKQSGTTWFEVHANLAPMQELVAAQAPMEARAMLTSMGVDSMTGFNASMALDGGLMRNTIALLTRDRGDVLSSCFRGCALDRGFARLVPEDSDSAILLAFDLETASDSIRSHLPMDAKPEFDSMLAEFEAATGLDPHDALLKNFGPNVMFASRGSAVDAMTGADEYEAALAMQIRNQGAAEALFGMFLEKSKAAAKSRTAGDLRYVSFGVPVPQLAWLDFSIGISNGLLVMATSGEALERVFENAKTQDVRCARLAAALATTPDDAFYVSTSDTTADVQGMLGMMNMGALDPHSDVPPLPFDLPTAAQVAEFCKGMAASVSTCRATDTGLVYESVGPVNLPWSGAPSLAIIAAIAIPNLMEARSSSNEAAAIATLRNLSSAQAQFQACGAKDRDGDGIGEYGTFGELAGKIAMPDGTKLNPPVLSSKFANIERGVVQRSGYMFAVILPGPGALPQPEIDDGGAGPNVDAELAEVFFTAYAWPVDLGSTGTRMFAIDQGGTVWTAHAGSFDPPCSGYSSPPPLMDVFDFDKRHEAARTGAVKDFVWEPVD